MFACIPVRLDKSRPFRAHNIFAIRTMRYFRLLDFKVARLTSRIVHTECFLLLLPGLLLAARQPWNRNHIVWMALSMVRWLRQPNWAVVSVNVPDSSRNSNGTRSRLDASVGMILLPTVLGAITLHNHDWEVYERVASVAYALRLFGGGHCSDLLATVTVGDTLIHLVARNQLGMSLVFFACLEIFYGGIGKLKHLSGLASADRFLVGGGMALALMEWINIFYNQSANKLAVLQEYDIVSLTGLLGTCLAVRWTLSLRVQPWLTRALVALGIPVIAIEFTMRWMSDLFPSISTRSKLVNFDNIIIPRSIVWLHYFLRECEEPLHLSVPTSISRYCWLLYWFLVLVIFLPLAPSGNINRTRKWFHMIACFLFIPGTIAAPRLQSLSYAIAIGLMLGLESIRRDIPSLNKFYLMFLDSSKGESENSFAVSHLALILGCALPLWITQATLGITSEHAMITSIWGVITLGIGDSISAIVGSTWGRTPWSFSSQRTVEGTVAMFISMTLSLIILPIPSGLLTWTVWITVLCVCMMEAFVTQLDNLVLPLYGMTMLLQLM